MNHPVIQQYWRWCQNSISASCGYELLIISNEILHIPITLWGSSSFDNKETRTFLASIFFLRLQNFAKLPLPWQACLVWRVKTICCSQLPRHYKGSHAYSKVWRTNKTITFRASELLPLLLSCQISIGSKFCINDDDDWEILIYQTCPPRQQIIFKAAQEHNNGFKLCFLIV